MKGVLFNVTEDVVEHTLGAADWDAALDRAGLDGVYTSLGDYPDGDLAGIVAAVSERSGMTPDEVLRHVGRHGYGPLVRRQPDLVEGITDLGALLHELEDVIHPEVHKLYADARPPSFSVRDVDEGTWRVEYRSDRRLCHLAEGLIEGAAAAFDTGATITQAECVHRGDDRCVLVVTAVGEGHDRG